MIISLLGSLLGKVLICTLTFSVLSYWILFFSSDQTSLLATNSLTSFIFINDTLQQFPISKICLCFTGSFNAFICFILNIFNNISLLSLGLHWIGIRRSWHLDKFMDFLSTHSTAIFASLKHYFVTDKQYLLNKNKKYFYQLTILHIVLDFQSILKQLTFTWFLNSIYNEDCLNIIIYVYD